MAGLIGAEMTAEVVRKLAEVMRSERPPIPPSASFRFRSASAGGRGLAPSRGGSHG
jgi:hypothetical protein